NPGRCGATRFCFVELDSAPRAVRALAARFRRAGLLTRVLDITCEVGIPTFEARIFEDPFAGEVTSSSGWGAHPTPEVAILMALFEAAQTRVGNLAGAREDLTIQARSLGRHERARPVLDDMLIYWYGSDAVTKPFAQLQGFAARNLRDQIQWCLSRLRAAGYPHVLVADLSIAELRPARAVRVIIPGMETDNPYFTGPRARATLVRDLLQ